MQALNAAANCCLLWTQNDEITRNLQQGIYHMNLQPLAPYLSVAEIILAIVLIVLVLMQSKGSDLGSLMGGGGGDAGGYRTKRGVEATLHKVTIYFCIAFFIVTLLTFISWGQAA